MTAQGGDRVTTDKRIDEWAKWAADVRGDMAELNLGLTRDEARDIAECFTALIECYRAAIAHSDCPNLRAAIEKVDSL